MAPSVLRRAPPGLARLLRPERQAHGVLARNAGRVESEAKIAGRAAQAPCCQPVVVHIVQGEPGTST